MQEKKFNEAKKEVRSVLLTYKERVSLDEFLKTYRGLIGQRLPSRTLGFYTDLEFLQSMPDVVDIFIDSIGRVYLTGIADAASKHIQKLVSKQRQSKSSNTKLKKRQPIRKLPDTSFNVRELQPFLPGALRVEILELMSILEGGVSLAAFVLAYFRKFKKYLPLAKGLATLEGMIKLIPELELRIEKDEKKIFLRNTLTGIEEQDTNNSKKSESSPVQSKDNKNGVIQGKNRFNIHESGIPDDVLQNFQLLLERCPDGILDIHFPPLYENITGKSFDLLELGYNKIIDLVDALPNIFERIINPDDKRHWVILPAKPSITHSSKESSQQLRKGIPADASSPSLQYIEPAIPSYVNLNEYVPVFVSAIINPSLFWFQLQTDEAIKKFEDFEKDMGYFYNNFPMKYQMKNADIAIGAACVVQCPDDDQWYRGVIKSLPSTEFVNVLFVDYGSRENVPRKNVYYVRSKYHEYPACAFQAELSGLKPSGNALSWSIQSQQRFIQLCDSAILMAYIMPIDKDTYSLYLCDTRGESDIHLNDTLINEGYAEISLQNGFNASINGSPSEPEAIYSSNGIPIDSESDLSSRSDQCMLQSNSSEIIPESKTLSANKRFSFTDEQPDDVELSASYSSKRQDSKRYVKVLELCEDNKIHVINLENKLFISCGALCGLLWSENDPNFLIERLTYKEVKIPFLTLKKDDHVELFEQCIWYKITDFVEFDSNNSSVILCPLEEAFNVLNIFGHPSVCLRLAIQNEIRNYDPHDPLWKEFSYEESSNINDIEKEIQQKLSKLCLYDLKAKYEALKIKRLKLLRVNATSAELKKIENLQNIIEKRMKQIETICFQYSSCT